jgi:hypothetical protein
MSKLLVTASARTVGRADTSRLDLFVSKIKTALKNRLKHRRFRQAILLVGVVLVLPSISNRLVLDDYLQVLTRISAPRVDGLSHSWIDLFAFGKPGNVNRNFIDRGILLPWWTYSQYRVAFFRPLSALTHDIDGWLWPHSPAMAHLHSIAWYFLLLLLVLSLYERFAPSPSLAGLAFLLFAIDDTHGDTINWLANRHAIIATVLGLLMLMAHDRYRSGRGGMGAWVGPAMFGITLLAGETAIAACAFVFSYALFVDPAPRRSRALSVLPYVIIGVLWRAAYQRLGYGAFGGDAYIDPGREFGAFISRFFQSFPVLLQGQLGFIPSDAWTMSLPSTGWVFAACGYGFFAIFLGVVYLLLRHRRIALFWLTAMVGAIIPSTAAPPGDRLLLCSGIAAAPLLAELFSAFIDGLSPLLQRRAWRSAIAVFLAAIVTRKVLFAPLLLIFRINSIDAIADLSDRAADAVPAVADISQRSLIIVNPPFIDLASYLPLIRAAHGQAVPRHVRWFAAATSDIAMTRTSDRSVRVRPSRGFLADRADRVFRSSRYPLALGEAIRLSDMTATVTELRADGNPAAVEFTFRKPLESSDYLWMRWDQHDCETFSPPRLGETITLPAIDALKLL